ncbi:hypothetical protein RHSIM_RhsimUnG0190900 [Rhododendron simsii]|uniref:Uncharacterized protein n=1 Tax=Rhododendron simsii TaxID=118357 RepID=A0A834L485_RHOSS|nr:hypothetical protein RHSIM_RhsimUnG0190900 [Rhododendron simsii]
MKEIRQVSNRDLLFRVDRKATMPCSSSVSHSLILHSLETGDYMDLSYLVLKEMASALQDNYKALPYGALLTRLFMRDGVSLTREQTLPNDPGAIRDYVFTRGHINDEEAPNLQVNVVQEQENIAG